MTGNQSFARAAVLRLKLPRGSRFLLGAVPAAILVLTIAGAGLMLSRGLDASIGDSGHYRLPKPQLSLGAVPARLA